MALGGNDVRERPTKLFEPSWFEKQLQDPGVCILVPSRCDCYITFTNVPSVQNNWCPQKGGWLTVFGSRQLKQHEQPNSCKSTALQILCLFTCKKGVGGATKLLRIIFYHWQQQWFQEAYQCFNVVSTCLCRVPLIYISPIGLFSFASQWLCSYVWGPCVCPPCSAILESQRGPDSLIFVSAGFSWAVESYFVFLDKTISIVVSSKSEHPW